MGTRITERARGLLVTVIGVDDGTETYSFSRDDLPSHFADLANTLDMVLQKANAPKPEVGHLPPKRIVHEPPVPKPTPDKPLRKTQKALV